MLPRQWDGKSLSKKGTIRSSFRLISGSEPEINARWATYGTSISEGHLWIGKISAYVSAISPSVARKPDRRELTSLDRDSVVVPVTTRSGARLEWAIRSSELHAAIQRLGSVTVD